MCILCSVEGEMYCVDVLLPTVIVTVAPLVKAATLRVAVDTLSGLTCQGTVTKYFGPSLLKGVITHGTLNLMM